MDAPIGGSGGLTSLDADFLDGMLALGQQAAQLCEKYISDSDVNSSARVVEMARGIMESAGYQTQMLQEMRGYADGDELRQADHLAGVEVAAHY